MNIPHTLIYLCYARVPHFVWETINKIHLEFQRTKNLGHYLTRSSFSSDDGSILLSPCQMFNRQSQGLLGTHTQICVTHGGSGYVLWDPREDLVDKGKEFFINGSFYQAYALVIYFSCFNFRFAFETVGLGLSWYLINVCNHKVPICQVHTYYNLIELWLKYN